MRGILSLQKPLGNTEDLTLEDIIASPELPADDAEYKRNGKPQGRSIILDTETIQMLRRRFGNLPLGRVIRSLVGLPPLEKQEAWQKWEDDIIKDCYSWGGSMAVIAQGVNRSRNAVIARARKLGVRRGIFKPNSDWLTLCEVANIFKCHPSMVHKWCKLGYLESVKLRAPIKRFLFITEQALINFIKNFPFVYPHENLTSGYKYYLPQVLSQWVSVKEAAATLSYSVSGVNNHIDRGQIPVRNGFDRQRYVRLEDLRAYLNNPPKRKLLKRPSGWKLLNYGERKHLVEKDKSGCWYLICRSKSERPAYNPEWQRIFGYRPRFVRGNPSCKVCLAKLQAIRS